MTTGGPGGAARRVRVEGWVEGYGPIVTPVAEAEFGRVVVGVGGRVPAADEVIVVRGGSTWTLYVPDGRP